MRLFERGEAGHADLDWSVGGGVMFGKQKVSSRSETTGTYEHGTVFYPQIDPINETSERRVSKSVSVPNLSASLGISYTLDRLKLSTGYRWERYYNVIDGGVEEHKSYDRTIDGPYFKLSVGFGG